MRSTLRWPIAFGLVVVLVLLSRTGTDRDVVAAQTRKPVFITRLYTGPDGQTHSQEIEANFATDSPTVFKMMAVAGAELHRASPGTVVDWHPGPRRQYVITLSGRGELEVAGGQKIAVAPGHIELIEDTTGKGHITRVIGNDDRVTLWLPLADQSAR